MHPQKVFNTVFGNTTRDELNNLSSIQNDFEEVQRKPEPEWTTYNNNNGRFNIWSNPPRDKFGSNMPKKFSKHKRRIPQETRNKRCIINKRYAKNETNSLDCNKNVSVIKGLASERELLSNKLIYYQAWLFQQEIKTQNINQSYI